jgi:molybdopterin molybdotransferase
MAQRSSRPVSLEDALAWIDANTTAMAVEEVSLTGAAGRILARPVAAAIALPPFDRAAADGLAVRAHETLGASIYNPLSFELVVAPDALPKLGTVRVNAGDPLPRGADAVLPLDHAALDAAAGRCEIVEPTVAGSLVERAGSQAPAGAMLLPARRRIGPAEIGLLAAAGMADLPVVRRPEMRVLTIGRDGSRDADGPLLRALIERDGAVMAELRRVERNRESLRAALLAPGPDIILVAGGTGEGSDDLAAEALAEAGLLAVHGVALRPGESAGMGRLGSGAPVFLLPGAPASCLWTYELLAGRGVRRMAGRSPALPFPTKMMRLTRKIVSSIGVTEIHPLRCGDGDEAAPIASFAEAGLMSAAAADGFVLIPEGSEGLAEGALITAHLYAAS